MGCLLANNVLNEENVYYITYSDLSAAEMMCVPCTQLHTRHISHFPFMNLDHYRCPEIFI